MTTETENTVPDTGFIADIPNTALVLLGMGNITPNANHVRIAAIAAALAAYIFGVMRGKAAPDSNVLGF